MISGSCKYALRAAIYLAHKKEMDGPVKVAEIAAAIGAPAAFIAKLLQTLQKEKIITSVKGAYGGYLVTEKQAEQTLLKIVAAIDGTGFFNECALGLKNCSSKKPCPLHDEYKKIRETLAAVFDKTTLQQLAMAENSDELHLI